MRTGVGVLLLLGLAAGCSNPVGVREGTVVSFGVQPAEVDPGGSLMAVLEIKNVSGGDLTLIAGEGCIARLRVQEANWGDAVRGTGGYCTHGITEFPLGAGERLTRSWEITAEKQNSGKLLDPGDYHLEAMILVAGLERPVVEFRVRGGG